MYAVHLLRIPIKNLMRYLRLGISSVRCVGDIRNASSQRKSHILLNIVTFKTDPCLVPRRVKKYIIDIMHIFCVMNSPLGRVAQSVTCLATDAWLTADPGVESSIPARSHTFVEIDHEIISTVILLPSADAFKKGCCQLQAKVCAQITA